MRAGNKFLCCTDAEGGRERPGQGPRLLGRPAAQKEVFVRCRPPWEQVRRRVSAEPCERPSRGKEQCGAAQWPRLRRHLADKLPRTADL